MGHIYLKTPWFKTDIFTDNLDDALLREVVNIDILKVPHATDINLYISTHVTRSATHQ